MTTIIYDGKGNVGADTRVSWGSLYHDQQPKLMRGKDFILGFSGAFTYALKLLKKYGPDFSEVTAEQVLSDIDGWEALLEKMSKDSNDLSALLFAVHGKQVVVMELCSSGVWIMNPNNLPCAIGSGAQIALGAVAAGANLANAIAISAQFVHDVGPYSQILHIQKELRHG